MLKVRLCYENVVTDSSLVIFHTIEVVSFFKNPNAHGYTVKSDVYLSNITEASVLLN